MIKHNKKSAFLFLLFIAVIMVFVVISHNRNIANLRKDFVITEGRFIDFYRGVKTGGGTKFSFAVDGTIYYGRGESPSVKCQPNLISRKKKLQKISLPVIYESGNPENAEILIFQSQYEYYGVDVPMEILDFVLNMSKC